MRHAAKVVMIMAVSSLATVGLRAQAKPNFAGKWTLDSEKTAAANPASGGGVGRGGGGYGMTIAQDATTLTITRESPNGPLETKYKLDGSEQTVTTGQSEAKIKAKVVGATIVVETTREINGSMYTNKSIYAMEGNWLVISASQPGRSADVPMRKTYYKKG